jgi:hypothetical protein
MSVALNNPMSLEDFLDWESRQEFLFNRLRGHRCRAHGSDLKIQVVGRIRYRTTRSIQRDVILEQIRPAAAVYPRAGDDWVADVLVGEAGLMLREIGPSMVLSEIYEGVPFPPHDVGTVAGT